jgi:hypothetical protein
MSNIRRLLIKIECITALININLNLKRKNSYEKNFSSNMFQFFIT